MSKIIDVEQAAKISNTCKNQNKKVVLVGGCFDILHIGHIDFLEKAKKHGDILMILLESDENIRRFKGNDRPINTQGDRAQILAALSTTDYIILSDPLKSDNEYEKLVRLLQPAIIATTIGDKKREKKERQAALIDAQVVDVNMNIANVSTSRLATLLAKEL